MVTIPDAVDEMVTAAWGLYGGKGWPGSRVMRPGKGQKGNKMQIYIAGKITGLDSTKCYVAFKNAEYRIAELGHEPLNPYTLVDQDPDRTYEDYLLDALEIVLCSAQALYMLPNWRDSLGARIEHAIAVEKGLPIYYAASELPEAGR